MDFEMDSADFTPERVAEIERRANEELRAGGTCACESCLATRHSRSPI